MGANLVRSAARQDSCPLADGSAGSIVCAGGTESLRLTSDLQRPTEVGVRVLASAPPHRRQPPSPLSDQDKMRLQRTWKALEADPTAVGVIVFTRLFEAHPEMQGAFLAFRDADIEELKASTHLRQHASKVMGFVNKVVNRLDSDGQFAVITSELCTRHIAYGAYPHQMQLLGEQFISVVRDTQEESGRWDQHTQTSWEKLFQWISWTYDEVIFEARRRHLELSAHTHPLASIGCLATKRKRRVTNLSLCHKEQ